MQIGISTIMKEFAVADNHQILTFATQKIRNPYERYSINQNP